VGERWSDDERIPGRHLVSRGLADLAAGRETIEAMLVVTGAERLRELGRHVPEVDGAGIGLRLYALVEADVGEVRAHSRYNALRRRLLSYLRTAAADGDAPRAG
jgi:hypothetical protein